MLKNVLLSLVIISAVAIKPPLTQATDHYSLIINQVRGQECCDPGSASILKEQLKQLDERQLIANFTLRYDAITNPEYSQLFVDSNHQVGAHLEIIPSLAKAAQVEYQADQSNWYQAHHAYLIGYSQEERLALIDQYMEKFNDVFGYYPSLSTAWMIDSYSLEYLKDKYQVKVHQITREQFGTDSYTLHGGPAHYPYWPAERWAVIPANEPSQTQPLIVRQTIMDPVYGYGDRSDAYTSQPNDYLIRDANISYFEHLYTQAHQQHGAYTFSLIGLENSMDEKVQQEFYQQLKVIAKQSNNREFAPVTLRADEFEQQLKGKYQPFSVYTGSAQQRSEEKAWWVNSPNYRARVRLSNNQLFISDLRIYDQNWEGPYFQQPARLLGWWVVPFVIDGSRFMIDEQISNEPTRRFVIRNDHLSGRRDKYGQPSRIQLMNQASEQQLRSEQTTDGLNFYAKNKLIAQLNPELICLSKDAQIYQSSKVKPPIDNLFWYAAEGQKEWGLSSSSKQIGDLHCFQPFSQANELTALRQDYSELLFPELKLGQANEAKSQLIVHNKYALANRNPVRLIFAPKNQEGQPILAASPKVQIKPENTQLELKPADPVSGLVFIDLKSEQPKKVELTLQADNFKQNAVIFFAPNCKGKPLKCLTQPKQLVWFIKNWLQDRQLAKQEEISRQDKFVHQLD